MSKKRGIPSEMEDAAIATPVCGEYSRFTIEARARHAVIGMTLAGGRAPCLSEV